MVIDSSIFIEHLRAKNKNQTQLYQIPNDTEIFISTITLYELLMGATTGNKRTDIDNLTHGIPILSFNEEIALKAAEIYHQLRLENKMIEFRDIFIGATCLINDLSLKTLNKKHFDRIKGLRIE